MRSSNKLFKIIHTHRTVSRNRLWISVWNIYSTYEVFLFPCGHMCSKDVNRFCCICDSSKIPCLICKENKPHQKGNKGLLIED
jgi:hypothetical protein